MLIVPGTGLLTDAYGLLGWGPYNLMKWTLAARLRGCRVLFVSVGAGPLYSTLGRFCMRFALALADYRSFRDRASIRSLERVGFRTSDYRLYPDLAFGLHPDSLLPGNVRSQKRQRRLVGLGLMAYAERYSFEDPDTRTHADYLDALVVFVEWLLARDYDVRLLLGDSDTMVIDEFTSLLQERVTAYDAERVFYEPKDSVRGDTSGTRRVGRRGGDALSQCSSVSSAQQPVIAISFHHKCASLMEEVGLSEYCQDIDKLNGQKLIERFQELERNGAG